MTTHLRLIIIALLFFSCDGSVGTKEQIKEYRAYQDIFQSNKSLLMTTTAVLNRTTMANDLIELPLDKFVVKYKIEPTKISDLLSVLAPLADIFNSTSRQQDQNEDKLLVSKVLERLEIIDISIQTGFIYNISKIDTTKINKIGQDTLILK